MTAVINVKKLHVVVLWCMFMMCTAASAAVSTLTINTINSIEEFTDDCFNVSVDEESATIDFIAASYDLSSKAQVLLDACNLGLTGISNNYPDYLSITIKEV